MCVARVHRVAHSASGVDGREGICGGWRPFSTSDAQTAPNDGLFANLSYAVSLQPLKPTQQRRACRFTPNADAHVLSLRCMYDAEYLISSVWCVIDYTPCERSG